MIINGGARSNWRFFAKHLMRADENERVCVTEIRGLAGRTVEAVLREMDALATGRRVKNFFYHANLNPREGEQLTEAQWEQAVDTLERNLGLEGHSRFVVEHEKGDGRIHRHVIWSRLNPDSMTAVPDSQNYTKHELTARQLERQFGHEPVQGVLVERGDRPRPARRPESWETFRGKQSGIDPQAVKADLTELWQRADTGAAFRAALQDAGYQLCRGDRRDFVVVDAAGDEHSLARRIESAKAADIRARLADLDRDSLPSVAEGRMTARKAALRPASLPADAVESIPVSAIAEAAIVTMRPANEGPTDTGSHGDSSIAVVPRSGGQELLPGRLSFRQAVAPREPGAIRRVMAWGREWHDFADRAIAFGEGLHEFWQDDNGIPLTEKTWKERVAHLAMTGVKTVRPRDVGGWTEFVTEGKALARDLLSASPTTGSWRERFRPRSPNELGSTMLYSSGG